MRWRTRSNFGDSRLSDLVQRVGMFIRQRLTDAVPPDFYPQVIASTEGESYLAVLAALYVLEERGLVMHKYGVFCSVDNSLIGEEDTLDKARGLRAQCDSCEKYRSATMEDVYIDLYFVADKNKVLMFWPEAA